METKKIYYIQQDEYSHSTKIVNLYSNYIELESTIAFPEGGGQEADHGEIFLIGDEKIKINFIDTILIDSHKIEDINYPDCKIGGRILHKISQDSLSLINKLSVGDKVNINLDSARRDLITKSHSATHIMYMAIDLLKSNIVNNIIGCHIKPLGGRLDFRTDYRFSREEIEMIEEKANSIIKSDIPITIISDQKYSDVRYWICGDYQIPCGGTHTKKTGEIPFIKISRKSIGTGKERIIFSWLSN